MLRTLLVTFVLLGACDGAPGPLDAPADAGTPDAPAPFDPLRVHWEEREVPADALALWGHAAALLPDGTSLVFGGAIGDGSAASDDALIVDASSGLTVTTLPAPTPRPVERWCGCATYDGARERVIVAGGRNGAALEGVPSDTWLLDPGTGDVTELTGAGAPASVIGCALAYSEARRATYWFGGASGRGVSQATWRLDETAGTWAMVAGTGPTPRYDAHLEAIDGGRTLLLFAGSYGSAGAAFYSDVWRFDTETETWSEVVVEGDVPPGRRAPWVRLANGERGFYAGFGYDGMMRPLGDLFYFDLASATWTPVPLDPLPTARGFSPALSAGGAVGLLYMGLGSSSAVGDAWVLAPDP
jgi:hypothetical protein